MIFDWVLRASSASCLDLSLINCYMWRLANVVHVNFDGQHSIKTHVCSAMAGFPEYHSSQANHSKRDIRSKFCFCQIWSGFEAVFSRFCHCNTTVQELHKNALMRRRKNSMHRGKELLVEVFESTKGKHHLSQETKQHKNRRRKQPEIFKKRAYLHLAPKCKQFLYTNNYSMNRNMRFALPPNFMINGNKNEKGSVLKLPLWLHVG